MATTQFIHVKNLEKYHPGYHDRDLIWCKLYFSIINGDPEFEMLCEIDQWRFIKLIMLELQTKKPIPVDEIYLSRKGFDFKKRSMLLTLQMLHSFIEICNAPVTQEGKSLCIEKSNVREEVNVREDIYVDFEKSTINLWNLFCEKHPFLSKITTITDSRRKSLKARFAQNTFKDFPALLAAIEDQPFLLNGNPDSKDHKNWKISFDWLIRNDINHVKVLEKKYMNNRSNQWWKQ